MNDDKDVLLRTRRWKACWCCYSMAGDFPQRANLRWWRWCRNSRWGLRRWNACAPQRSDVSPLMRPEVGENAGCCFARYKNARWPKKVSNAKWRRSWRWCRWNFHHTGAVMPLTSVVDSLIFAGNCFGAIMGAWPIHLKPTWWCALCGAPAGSQTRCKWRSCVAKWLCKKHTKSPNWESTEV